MISRKGYCFKGSGTVLTEGALFQAIVAAYRRNGLTAPIRGVVLIEVRRALPLTSPAYDRGTTEAELRGRWQAYYDEVAGSFRNEESSAG